MKKVLALISALATVVTLASCNGKPETREMKGEANGNTIVTEDGNEWGFDGIVGDVAVTFDTNGTDDVTDDSIVSIKMLRKKTISQGDTLWDIASQYHPKDMEIREYIYALEQLNGIDAHIYDGQEIYIYTETELFV